MLRNRRARGIAAQVAGAVCLLALLVLLGETLRQNLLRLNLTTGFDFLLRPAGMRMGESVLPFDANDSFAWAIVVAGLNTLRVSAAAIVLATVLGVSVGLLRLSPNPLLRAITGAYVEAFRNTPVLLQILVWSAILLRLPPIKQALSLGGWVFLSQRGMQVPGVAFHDGALAVDWPVKHLFGFSGGLTLTPEFCALALGLIAYHATYIAEITRAGILAVPKGQWEAARSLGLHGGTIIRRIVLPQALRVMLPSITSQYAGIIKNSSLAVAIGYPDLFWAVSTAINVTGHAIEGVAVLMAAYLVLTLGTAGMMNFWYGRMLRRGAR
jgi:general L-amino acid transport system permease protein